MALKQSKVKNTFKSVVCTPFETSWPVVSKETEENIIDEIKATISKLEVAKPEEEAQLEDGKKSNVKQIKLNKVIHPQLLCGVNIVTRCLERGIVQLCVVDRSVPPHLTHHLLQLSNSRSCPAIAVNNLTQHLAPCLGITSCAVLGFKILEEGQRSDLDDCVKKVASLIGTCGTKRRESTTVETETMGMKIVKRDDMNETDDEKQEKPQIKVKNIKADYSHLYISIKESASHIRKQATGGDFLSFNDNENSDGIGISDFGLDIKIGLDGIRSELQKCDSGKAISKKRKTDLSLEEKLKDGKKNPKFHPVAAGRIQPQSKKKKKKSRKL